jgi:4-amino-4-deoxy-L-arabinose transferase-like glycosyltransferase
MTLIQRTGAFLLLLFCLWLPRLQIVERAVTVDEARWLLRSGNFYQALTSGNLADTYQHEQPGVTVTWAGMLGYFWRFPDYNQLAGGQILGPTSLRNLFDEYDQSQLLVLAAGRTLVVLALGLILMLAGLYAARLLGWLAAGLGLGLIAFDPFSLSLTYLLQPDGLASSLMLLSLLAFLAYCLAGRRRLDLLVSGLAGGLAALSKVPALFLLPFLGLISLIWLTDPWQSVRSALHWKRSALLLLIWAGIAGVTFAIFWPAMWVDPLGTLKEMFGQASRYAIQGNLNAVFFDGQIYASGESAWYFYPLILIWRVTPLLLGGLLLLVWRLIAAYRPGKPERMQASREHTARLTAGLLLLYAALFILTISLASQKYDRYLLPAWLALLILAGWGWAGLFDWLVGKIHGQFKQATRLAAGLVLGVALLAGQGLSAARAYPYYYLYYNPLLGGLDQAAQVLMIGWGEELDQAGQYLDTLPRPLSLRVIAWYGDGCLSYFFRGHTFNINNDTTLADLKQMDYVVTYYQQWQRQEPGPQVLGYLESLTPVHVIRVDGIDLVRIYQLR